MQAVSDLGILELTEVAVDVEQEFGEIFRTLVDAQVPVQIGLAN